MVLRHIDSPEASVKMGMLVEGLLCIYNRMILSLEKQPGAEPEAAF